MINEYIKQLSLHDKKSLTQKTLKLSEELGELSKVILPYEGAYATNHRVYHKNKILEELADIILVAKSIAYSSGFDDDELESMMFNKAQKWQHLQQTEDNSYMNGDKFPYEIHITVKLVDELEIPLFKSVCQSLSVKPIVLDLQSVAGEKVMMDVMTSSKFYGNNGEVMDEMTRIHKGLESNGFTVVRDKIESSYWHPKAPQSADDKMPDGCYFECHFGILVKSNEDEENLKKCAHIYGGHLSKNTFKKYDDGSYIQMFTFRSYDTYYTIFREQLDTILLAFKQHGDLEVEREIVEFSIYDTKITHDSEWLKLNLT